MDKRKTMTYHLIASMMFDSVPVLRGDPSSTTTFVTCAGEI